MPQLSMADGWYSSKPRPPVEVTSEPETLRERVNWLIIVGRLREFWRTREMTCAQRW